MRWLRHQVGMGIVVATACWVGLWMLAAGCGRDRGQEQDQAAEAEQGAALKQALLEGAEIRTEGVLRLYRFWEGRAQRSDDPVATMAMFALNMQEVGPKALPALLGVLAEPGVDDTWVFEAVRHIDLAHGTACYAEMLVSAEITAAVRAAAINHALSRGRAREAVERLTAFAADEARSKDQRDRAKTLIPKILAAMATTPVTPAADRDWARKKLAEMAQ